MKYFLSLIILFSFISICKPQETNRDKDTLAQIGKNVITSEQFIKSYSFGPSALKSINDAKNSYLDAMINEEILAQKLSAQNYNPSPETRKQLALTKQEMLVEKLFKEEVDKKIEVTEEEMIAEYKRTQQDYKLKYLYFNDRTSAENIYKELSNGVKFDSIYNRISLNEDPFVEAGETEYLNYNELQYPFNEKIFSLKPGAHSGIMHLNNSYIIVEINDVRANVFSTEYFNKNKERYRKIIYNRKGDELARAFVKNFMDPFNIVIDGEAFKNIVNKLYPKFKQANQPENNEVEFIKEEDFEEPLRDQINNTIVNFNSGEIAIKELFYHLSYRPLDLKSNSINSFAEKLRKTIGLVLRDVFMEKEAGKKGYDNEQNFVAELSAWKNNLYVHDYMNKLRFDIQNKLSSRNTNKNEKVNKQAAAELKKELVSQINEYKNQIEVKINKKVLNKIKVDDPQKGRLPEVKLFKLGLSYFKTAFPVPAKIWAFN